MKCPICKAQSMGITCYHTVENLAEIIAEVNRYINLFAEDLGYFYHQIKKRLEGKQ